MFRSEESLWTQAQLIAAKTRIEHLGNRLSILDDDFSHLVSSYDWLLENKNSTFSDEVLPLLINYTKILYQELRQRGLSKLLLKWCAAAIDSCETLGLDSAKIYIIRSEANSDLGYWDDALGDLKKIISDSESENSNNNLYARALFLLGRLRCNQGNYENAFELLTTSESLLSKHNDIGWKLKVLLEMGRYHLATRSLSKSIQILIPLGRESQPINKEVYYTTQLLLGVIYRKKRNYDRCIFYFNNILLDNYKNSDKRLLATTLHHLAWIYLEKNILTDAKKYCNQSIQYYDETGDNRGLSDSYEQLGLIFLAERNSHKSLRYLMRSLIIRRRIGNKHGQASSLRRLSFFYFKHYRIKTGLFYFSKSFQMYREIGIIKF
jgi:tetratricopeptide (TPR) repeat protein